MVNDSTRRVGTHPAGHLPLGPLCRYKRPGVALRARRAIQAIETAGFGSSGQDGFAATGSRSSDSERHSSCNDVNSRNAGGG